MPVRSTALAAACFVTLAAAFAAAAAEPRAAALNDFVDIDYFGIFPACDEGQAVAADAPAKDQKYCADMYETRMGTVEEINDLQQLYTEQLHSIDQTKPGFAGKLEALFHSYGDEENNIWAKERVLCHAIQAAYIGEQGVTITIRPDKYVLQP